MTVETIGSARRSVPFEIPRRAVRDISTYLAQLDPERITTSHATELFGLFAELTRLGSAGQVLLSPRVAQSDNWRNEGHRSAASWLAKQTGTGLGEAISSLETAERLQSLPRTTEALRNGKLSAPQVREIAAAAVGRPSAELELLDVAATGTLKGLKDQCRRVRAVTGSAEAENARYDAVHRSRFFRHWSDPDGAFRGEFKLTPDVGARLLSSIEVRANELFDEARKAGDRESSGAYRRRRPGPSRHRRWLRHRQHQHRRNREEVEIRAFDRGAPPDRCHRVAPRPCRGWRSVRDPRRRARPRGHGTRPAS